MPRVLRVLHTHTSSSPPSGGINSNMLITASAVWSTCDRRGSPHAVSMKNRQRQDRSASREPAVRAEGRDMHAARTADGSQP